jgi:hypothetical protein
MEKEKAVE